MAEHRLLKDAIASLGDNAEQLLAVQERGHCVVLAGPGSGKTKTLTIAMARALIEDVEEPQGIACITYNNECAIELETRLARLGVESSERVFIGTVHGFSLAHVIGPYARCVLPGWPDRLQVATATQRSGAVDSAYRAVFGDDGDPQDRWKYAAEKRRLHVDRSAPSWRGRNPELANFIEAYERELRRSGLIDFDDMPLVAYRIVREHEWVRRALAAKFPVLFVDEYQDLGHALHELVLLLCFGGGIRLFAVGDPDQSIYRFQGADPELLGGLVAQGRARTLRLRLNYRSGAGIIRASMAALGQDRGYREREGAGQGSIEFHPVPGGLGAQASFVFGDLLPRLLESYALDQVALLYRWAKHGDPFADAAKANAFPLVRADNNALVSRNSRLSRFVESCAAWVSGGWRRGEPRFGRLARDASRIILGPGAPPEDQWRIQDELMQFLSDSLRIQHTAHSWLAAFRREVLARWRVQAPGIEDDWDHIERMIDRMDPAKGVELDMPLGHFGGSVEGTGRLNLSTLHSSKGREFDCVVIVGADNDVIPYWRDRRDVADLREARRLFYVGVTRARHALHLVFNRRNPSDFVEEVRRRAELDPPAVP